MRKRSFLTSVASLVESSVWDIVFFNSSPFLPQIDLESCTQMGWKHSYKYFWALLGTSGVLLGTRSPICWNGIPGKVLALISIVSINATGYHMRLRQKPNFLKLKSTLCVIWFFTNQWLVPSHAQIQEYHYTTVDSDSKYHFLIEKSSEVGAGGRAGAGGVGAVGEDPWTPKAKKETNTNVLYWQSENTACQVKNLFSVCLSSFTISGQKVIQITSEVNCSQLQMT